MVLLQVATNSQVVDGLRDLRNILTAFGIGLTVIFGVITYWQKTHDKQIGLRKQLTEILEKLVNLNIEIAKYKIERELLSNKLPENYGGLINDYRRFFVTHAAAIVAEMPKSKTFSHELSLIAQAFDNIDDNLNAEKFFNKAIERAENTVDKILSSRSYARYVFNKVDRRSGDEMFNKIINSYENETSESIIYYRAETYKRWGTLYKGINEIEYKRLMGLAKLEFSKLKNEITKNGEIKRIDNLISPPVSPTI